MKFGAPHNTVWLWLVFGLIVFYIWAFRSRRKALEKFANFDLLKGISKEVSIRRKKIKSYMVIIAFTFLIIALMRPQWGFRWQEVKRHGLDILIALDTSNSMLAEDVLPNRLERSKLAVKDLVKKLKGDRMGLVCFAGRAFLQCPLTIDYDGFLLSLEDVGADTIPLGGTAISQAINVALKSYEGGGEKYKILVIITDGEDHEGGIDNAIQRAKEARIKIFCVGIGSSEGELIPIDTSRGKREFLKDAEGNIVKTRLNESLLQKIALETGGAYVRGTGAELGLDVIYDKWLSKMEKQELKSKMEKQYYERFQLPLAIAFLLLLIEPLIGDRRKEKT